MSLIDSKIFITEYEPKYAKSIAEMWNKSSSSWNGHVFNYDEAQIAEEQKNSSAVASYLVVKGNDVLAYADLFHETKGRAHIGMLNVLPEYHGGGLGKLLVQRCVLKTVELGVPTLSLFTWAGNTKAVPLYKKCGFFWQVMETPSTYLMNFLPGIMNNELLAQYFDYFHWYDDLVRDLAIQPDGEKVNGFTYYSYNWHKLGKRLRVTVEKGSWQIVEIESPDFCVSIKAAHPKPVFGSKQQIDFHYESFNPDFQMIELKSLPNESFVYDYSYRGFAKPALTLQAEYLPRPFDGVNSEWEAMPALNTKLTVAGKSLILGISQNVRPPVKIDLIALDGIQTDIWQTLHVNLESNLETVVTLKLLFPEDDKVVLAENVHEIHLAALERKILPVRYKTSGSCIYKPKLKLEYSVPELPLQSFETEPATLITTYRGCDGKSTKNEAMIVAGKQQIMMPFRDQKNWVYFVGADHKSVCFRPSDFGPPFSEEFEEEDARRIEYWQNADVMMMEVFYESKQHPGLRFSKQYSLRQSGEMELIVQLHSVPTEMESYCLREMIGTSYTDFSFAKNGELVCLIKNCDRLSLADIDITDIKEPWLFFAQDQTTVGITWHPGWKLSFAYWWAILDIDLKEIQALPDMKSPAIRVYHNCFKSAYGLRDFVMGEYMDTLPKAKSIDLVVNGHNPVCQDTVIMNLVYHHKMALEHSLEIPSLNFSAPAQAQKDYQIRLPENPLNLLDAKLKFPYFDVDCKHLLLKSSGELQITEDEDVIGVDNGFLKISAPKTCDLPLISSMQVQGMEWLDPAAAGFGPKSGINPYCGGMFNCPNGMNVAKMMNESHNLSLVAYRDQHGNRWQGLGWETRINENEANRGLAYIDLYLTMPGLPVLLRTVEIVHVPPKAGFNSFYLSTYFHDRNIWPKAICGYPDEKGVWQETGTSRFNTQVNATSDICRMKVEDIRLYTLSAFRRYLCFHNNKDILSNRSYIYSKVIAQSGDVLKCLVMIFSDFEIDIDSTRDMLELQLKRES